MMLSNGDGGMSNERPVTADQPEPAGPRLRPMPKTWV